MKGERVKAERIDLEHLRRVAEAADKGGRQWEWTGGYPQTVLRVGDVVLVADTHTNPDAPAVFAEFIATFDPPTVLRLLDRIGKRHTLTDEDWNAA